MSSGDWITPALFEAALVETLRHFRMSRPAAWRSTPTGRGLRRALRRRTERAVEKYGTDLHRVR